jgi:hypothetical protein
MNSIRNGLRMRKAGDCGEPSQPENPHPNAVFTKFITRSSGQPYSWPRNGVHAHQATAASRSPRFPDELAFRGGVTHRPQQEHPSSLPERRPRVV